MTNNFYLQNLQIDPLYFIFHKVLINYIFISNIYYLKNYIILKHNTFNLNIKISISFPHDQLEFRSTKWDSLSLIFLNRPNEHEGHLLTSEMRPLRFGKRIIQPCPLHLFFCEVVVIIRRNKRRDIRYLLWNITSLYTCVSEK